MNTKVIGYLALIRIPELSVGYKDVLAAAQVAGFDAQYAPRQPGKANAWKKATNLGSSGLKVEPPQHKSVAIKAQYRVRPKVRLHTKVISDKSPNLIRHIVRTVTVPVKSTGNNKRILAETQLDTATVCIMEFNAETGQMKSTSQAELYDDQDWVNGDLRQVIQDLHHKVKLQVDFADNGEIRNGIRNWLFDNSATLMTAGGAYFLPNYEKLDSLKTYLESLDVHQVDKQATPPQVMIVAVNEDGSGDRMVSRDVASNAISQFKTKLQALADELKPVIGANGVSARSENVSDKVRSRVTVEYLRIRADVEKYRSSLGDNMAGLEVYLTGAANIIEAAQRVDQYKVKK